MPPRHELFITCAPGLEPLLHAEVRALKLSHVEQQVGGVFAIGTMRDAWKLNLELRTAIRVLLRLARFPARDQDELYRGVQSIDWTEFLAPDGTLIVDAHAKNSSLTHTRFLEQRVKDAVVDQFRERSGMRPSVDKEDADVAIYVHLFQDRCTLLADTSGGSLHKRGWRQFQGRAPLAETLAAAMVLESGWDARTPVLDPFCGSGTILIEAALIAADMAPGLFRKGFGFERWPGHEARAYAALVAATRARAKPTPKLILEGIDASPEAIAGARENAAAAGLEGRISFRVGDVREFRPRRGWNAWVIANPPYGERVGDKPHLDALYAQFARALRESCSGYHVCLLSGNPALERELPWKPVKTRALKNGALECNLLLYEV